jgi:hypothetical protein
MAIELNLLPENARLTGPVAQLVKFTRPLNIILLALFFVMALGMGGFFIFSFFSLQSLTSVNSDLESQIQNESTAQQQIVLLKDRISKIKAVQKLPEASKNLNKVSPLVELVSGSSYISELDIDSQKIGTSIVFRSNSDLTSFLEKLSEDTNYLSVSLDTFNYSPSTGYQTDITLTAK